MRQIPAEGMKKKNDTNNNNKNTKLQSNKEMGLEYMLY